MTTRRRTRWAALALTLLLTGCATIKGTTPMAAGTGNAAPGVEGASPNPGQGSVDAVPQHGPPLASDAARERGNVASGGPAAPYNYAPSVIKAGSTTRMWWCSQLPGAGPAGDDVLSASAPTPNGPFSSGKAAASAVFSGSGHGFDAVHTCDPSVIEVNGTYYLYYTGSAADRAHDNAIGVATSSDGTHWTRANGDRPIVTSSMGQARDNTYGTGQPSALYLDGWFYLLYTDTSNRSAGWNGAGQFVLRAKDPTFASGVQGLSDGGFIDADLITPGNAKTIVDAFSADWMFSDALNAFAVAHETQTGTTVTFYDRDLRTQPYQPVVVRGTWQEGPGLVRRADGHAPISLTDPCGRVPIDVIRATVNSKAPTGLSHFGLDITGAHGCQNAQQALALLRGYGVISPERTVDIVVDGGLVRVDRRSVAEAIAAGVSDSQVPVLGGAPVLAKLSPQVPAVQAPGSALGLVLSDGKLWPVGNPAVATLNSSAPTTISARQWNAYPRGPDLSRLKSR